MKYKNLAEQILENVGGKENTQETTTTSVNKFQ